MFSSQSPPKWIPVRWITDLRGLGQGPLACPLYFGLVHGTSAVSAATLARFLQMVLLVLGHGPGRSKVSTASHGHGLPTSLSRLPSSFKNSMLPVSKTSSSQLLLLL